MRIFFIFSETNFDAADTDLERDTKAEFPFVNDLELFRLTRTVFDKIRHLHRRPYSHMLLKTQGLWLAGMSRKILRRSKSAATWSATSFHSQTNFQYCRPGWKRAGKEASNNPHVNGSPEESCAPGLKSRWTEALVLRGIFIFVTNNSPSFIPNAPNQCIKFW